MKRYADATPLTREVLVGAKKINNLDLLTRGHFTLGALTLAQGDYSEAESEALAALAAAKRLPVPRFRQKLTGESLQLLVEIYTKSNQAEKAAEYQAMYIAATQPATQPTTEPSNTSLR
jgi:hypothetical protein